MSESVRAIRNLVSINPIQVKKTAVITSPKEELEALEKIAGPDKKITAEDFDQKTVRGQKNLEILLSMEGRNLYINDLSHGLELTVKDLEKAMDILKQFRAKLGQEAFNQVIIHLNESWHGSGAYPGDTHAHHLILNGVSFKKEDGLDLTPEESSQDRLSNLQTVSSEEVPQNFTLTPGSKLLKTQSVKVRQELPLLKKIAALAGDQNQIEQADLDSPLFKELIEKLEGKGLYQNDRGRDALRYDLRRALEALQYISEKYPDKNLKAVFEEEMLPENDRHLIKRVRIFNESNGYSFEIFPASGEK